MNPKAKAARAILRILDKLSPDDQRDVLDSLGLLLDAQVPAGVRAAKASGDVG